MGGVGSLSDMPLSDEAVAGFCPFFAGRLAAELLTDPVAIGRGEGGGLSGRALGAGFFEAGIDEFYEGHLGLHPKRSSPR